MFSFVRSTLVGAVAPMLVIAGAGAVAQPITPLRSDQADVQLATTVMAMGGLGYETLGTDVIAGVLGGRYANAGTLLGLPWPGEMTPWNGTLTLNESVAVGLENMDAAIRNTPGPKIVAGASGATLVVDEEMRRLANDPTAPPADELSFVVLGDANRGAFRGFTGMKLPIFEYTVPSTPVTKYDLLVLKGEYDGIGDWPDRSWNLLADLNALAATGLLQQIIPQDIVDKYGLDAWGSVHRDSMFADLTQVPAKYVTTSTNILGGVTTTYVVPTADLPLLRPLQKLGVDQDVIDNLEKVLRPIIDSAYVRNDPVRSLPIRRPRLTTPTPVPSVSSVTSAALLRASAQRETGSARNAVGRVVKRPG